jgi:hypothetical protein
MLELITNTTFPIEPTYSGTRRFEEPRVTEFTSNSLVIKQFKD